MVLFSVVLNCAGFSLEYCIWDSNYYWWIQYEAWWFIVDVFANNWTFISCAHPYIGYNSGVFISKVGSVTWSDYMFRLAVYTVCRCRLSYIIALNRSRCKTITSGEIINEPAHSYDLYSTMNDVCTRQIHYILYKELTINEIMTYSCLKFKITKQNYFLWKITSDPV